MVRCTCLKVQDAEKEPRSVAMGKNYCMKGMIRSVPENSCS